MLTWLKKKILVLRYYDMLRTASINKARKMRSLFPPGNSYVFGSDSGVYYGKVIDYCRHGPILENVYKADTSSYVDSNNFHKVKFKFFQTTMGIHLDTLRLITENNTPLNLVMNE